MAVKITSSLPGLAGLPELPHSTPASAPRREPEVEAGTQVELSSLSARLQELGAAATADPTVNMQRVAELRQAIREGRFQVNPERIADALLREARQLLSRQRGQQNQNALSDPQSPQLPGADNAAT